MKTLCVTIVLGLVAVVVVLAKPANVRNNPSIGADGQYVDKEVEEFKAIRYMTAKQRDNTKDKKSSAEQQPLPSVLRKAPNGADGRVVDEESVRIAKAQHAAAHINQKAELEKELVRTSQLHTLIY